MTLLILIQCMQVVPSCRQERLKLVVPLEVLIMLPIEQKNES
jgi:hypothetical protein